MNAPFLTAPEALARYEGRWGAKVPEQPRLWINGVATYHCDFPKAYAAWQKAREQRDDCWSDSEDKYRCGEDTGHIDDCAAKHDDRAGELSEWMAEEVARMTGLSRDQLREVLA